MFKTIVEVDRSAYKCLHQFRHKLPSSGDGCRICKRWFVAHNPQASLIMHDGYHAHSKDVLSANNKDTCDVHNSFYAIIKTKINLGQSETAPVTSVTQSDYQTLRPRESIDRSRSTMNDCEKV